MDEETRREVTRLLKQMTGRVYLRFFKPEKEEECMYCKEEEELLNILSSLAPSGKIIIEKYSSKSEEALKYSVDLFPALLVHGEGKNYGIRFFGIPAGYEFAVLIEDIIDVSRGSVDLDKETLEILRHVDEPVKIKVFVTPSCPYCPIAVRTAHKFAMANENVSGDMMEALEFREFAEKYNVYAVPKVIINDVIEFEGAIPAKYFAVAVVESIGKRIPGLDFKEIYKRLRSR
ncbi:MAG: thioredoxin family protein [Thermoproteales archaeon]|nr:thioredoxin family protein [Thermoproteales archaeon]RLE65861.1 MAG: glutaredoxin [Thermoprotei archaeon]